MIKRTLKPICSFLVVGIVNVGFLISLGCEKPSTLQELNVSSSNDRDTQTVKNIELELNVMTFNIRMGIARDGANHWDNRKDMVVDVIRSEKPDVVGLQEAFRFQIDYIRKALPQYAETGLGRDDGKQAGEYSNLLFLQDRFELDDSDTFWFSNTPDVPASRHWGNSIPRICSWARLIDKQHKHAFYVYNNHWDHRSQASREMCAVFLADYISQRAHKDPFIITGDMNAGEKNRAILYLKGKTTLSDITGKVQSNPVPVVDTFRVLHQNAERVGTFNGFKGAQSGEKIDYVLVQPDVFVLKANIHTTNDDGRYPSDHFPVSAHIIFSSSRMVK